VRRLSAVDLMLLGTVLLWALNITVTKYVLQHGFRPLAYTTIRYFAATSLFWSFTYVRERSLRIHLSDRKLVALAAVLIYVNQLGFVYGVDKAGAATVALMLGTTPIWVAIIATAAGFERVQRSFWAAAALSFAGVGLVAAGTGGLSARLGGDALAVFTAMTWAGYSTAIAPLMRRYSPFRISALVLALGWIPLAGTGIAQTLHQGFHFHTLTWIGFGYAVIGPLFLTNILWFTAIARVGPSRASLFANLQPFLGVVFALVLLGEHLSAWEVAGGLAIFAAIGLERVRRRPLEPVVTATPGVDSGA
jgi:drug/metabolite transporter (DMT)-like permease